MSVSAMRWIGAYIARCGWSSSASVRSAWRWASFVTSGGSARVSVAEAPIQRDSCARARAMARRASTMRSTTWAAPCRAANDSVARHAEAIGALDRDVLDGGDEARIGKLGGGTHGLARGKDSGPLGGETGRVALGHALRGGKRERLGLGAERERGGDDDRNARKH